MYYKHDNDCKVCKDVGLKEASQRLLSNNFLIGLCPECLDTTRAWWEEKLKAKNEGDTGKTGEAPGPSSEREVEVVGGATCALTPQESDHSYSNKAVTDCVVAKGSGGEELRMEEEAWRRQVRSRRYRRRPGEELGARKYRIPPARHRPTVKGHRSQWKER
ncbi:hypothetical protein E2C01_095774 [Portunus trituberculatus]|uniref:Uncharacterized protein n=1 Tax=Portunus trituberculatus TaxID=210409 RepID=A0A5B7JTW2_PORTR|nr:hypothetical protein [Portunus trituberculatus]